MKYSTNIMLIDDNKIDLFIHQRVIEKFDSMAHTMVFSNAIHAITYLEVLDATKTNCEKDFPQIIFLDINMPEMNGFQFLNEVKNISAIQRNRPQIYLLSSSTLPEDIKMANENVLCTNYINKPLTLEKITNLLALPRPNRKFLKTLKQLP
ncbi:MAG: response regulator [Altibacter sp.]|uniref:response regulator n=1 Tax=Altibacter sp. TaxID=2024823 RepID=UPI001D417C4E|nr:response regulator [Altibacter sp.]MBZ0326112.1 response regulator [Altibacter sp.]